MLVQGGWLLQHLGLFTKFQLCPLTSGFIADFIYQRVGVRKGCLARRAWKGWWLWWRSTPYICWKHVFDM